MLADKVGPPARASRTLSTPPAADQHRLPPDTTTRQTLELPGRTLALAATAGSIRLFDEKGEPQADIAYTSYQLDGSDRTTRPVTFVFNASVLHRAAALLSRLVLGPPERLLIEAVVASIRSNTSTSTFLARAALRALEQRKESSACVVVAAEVPGQQTRSQRRLCFTLGASDSCHSKPKEF